jgi:hypothetical protein
MRGVRTAVSSVLASTITMGIGAAELRSHDIASLELDGSPESSNRGGLDLARHGPLVGGSAARASNFCSPEQAEGQTALNVSNMKCFNMYFRKTELVGINARFYWIPRTFQLRQRQIGVTLPMGQRQNPAMSLLRSATPSPAVTSQEPLAKRMVHRPCPVRSQNAAGSLHICFPNPVVRQETEIIVSRPFIDLPDAEGFYASLVLRKVRAELQSRWELSECDDSSAKWNAVDQPSAAQTLPEMARCETAGEPLETLLAEIARYYVQTSVLGRRSS